MKTETTQAVFESWWAAEYGTLQDGSSDIVLAVMESNKRWAKAGYMAAIGTAVEPAPGQAEMF